MLAIAGLTPGAGVAAQLRGRDASKLLLLDPAYMQPEEAAAGPPPRTSPLV